MLKHRHLSQFLVVHIFALRIRPTDGWTIKAGCMVAFYATNNPFSPLVSISSPWIHAKPSHREIAHLSFCLFLNHEKWHLSNYSPFVQVLEIGKGKNGEIKKSAWTWHCLNLLGHLLWPMMMMMMMMMIMMIMIMMMKTAVHVSTSLVSLF